MADRMGGRTDSGQAGDPATLDAARRLAARRRTSWPRRPLSGRISGLMWLLRLYVVAMMAVVALQLVRLV